jgi:hypothetical protein
MHFLGVIAALALGRALAPAPLLWLSPEGKVLLQGKPAKGVRITAGASTVDTPFGLGLDLDGSHGGLLLPDSPVLALNDSITVSTWVYLRGYVQAGPGAQILFRGDDRNGLDPYSLVVHSDGNVAFEINDATGGGGVDFHVPLKQWIHITASFDAALSEAKLWIDDRCVKTSEILHQPLINLSKDSAPGIGIGNVQNNKGPHNQPLNGIIADLRLYNAILRPAEAGYHPLLQRNGK